MKILKDGAQDCIEVLSVAQNNSFFDPAKMWDGGGYDQPRIEFLFRGARGVFDDTSCGGFGSRWRLEWGDYVADVNTMDVPPLHESRGHIDLADKVALEARFGIRLPE